MLYRVVVEVIYMTLIVTFITDDVFSRSQAVLVNALYYRQAKLGAHFRSQVKLGNELKTNY